MFYGHCEVYLGNYKSYSLGLNLKFVRDGKAKKMFSLNFALGFGLGGQKSKNVDIFCNFNVLAIPSGLITREVYSAELRFV